MAVESMPGHSPESTPEQPPRWKGRLAPWFAGAPFAVLAVCWIGLLATVESMASFGWLSVMWCACVVLLPLGVLGAVWGARAGDRTTMWWGIVAAVACLPGFVMGLVMVPFLLHSLPR